MITGQSASLGGQWDSPLQLAFQLQLARLRKMGRTYARRTRSMSPPIYGALPRAISELPHPPLTATVSTYRCVSPNESNTRGLLEHTFVTAQPNATCAFRRASSPDALGWPRTPLANWQPGRSRTRRRSCISTSSEAHRRQSRLRGVARAPSQRGARRARGEVAKVAVSPANRASVRPSQLAIFDREHLTVQENERSSERTRWERTLKGELVR